ncbi:ABC transporter permease [Haloechinothrix sp. LS1_15]|uniref:ABC transporter permease n=1 Tax=Haloechinothrix sp. LS1_15 TaxID=2652248 RepID=UPI002947C0EB|nr:ABC transporter permease [Haloechinothrix sp. LS1_15]MDV6012005.1 ABC transporter permease [Haloechinothrix sp. LS1_15]
MANLTATASSALRNASPGPTLRRLLGIALLLAVWEFVAVTSGARLMPTLSEIGTRVVFDIQTGALWFHARITLGLAFAGLLIAIVVGCAIGILMARSRWAEAMLQPILGATYPIPRLALYPILILVFGLGAAPKVTLVALECLYPMALGTYVGARAVTKDQLWLARNIGAGWFRTLRDVIVPAALPAMLTGLRAAAPIMLIVIVVTEMIGESRGLGYMLMLARANFEPDGVLAVVAVLGVLGFAFDRLIALLTRVLVFWERGVTL